MFQTTIDQICVYILYRAYIAYCSAACCLYKLTHLAAQRVGGYIYIYIYAFTYLYTYMFGYLHTCDCFGSVASMTDHFDVPRYEPGVNPPANCPWPRFLGPVADWFQPPIRSYVWYTRGRHYGHYKLRNHGRSRHGRPWVEPPSPEDIPIPNFDWWRPHACICTSYAQHYHK